MGATAGGLGSRDGPADSPGVTPSSWGGRLVPAALRPAATDQPVEDWAPGAADPVIDGDLLGWLGFTPGGPEAGPLLIWPRPDGWPAGPRSLPGRHRAFRPRAA